VTALPRDFHPTVNMWVYEELIGESKQKLTEIINTTHVNVKYLPGVTLPSNVVAVPDIVEAVKDATVLIFVIPHQFIGGLAKQLVGKLDSRARAISLIKGVDFDAAGDLVLISKKIEKELAINCSVLMGANVADEVIIYIIIKKYYY
jgi:glycerol-3-phosphate dehydrogenase (NAD+)